MRLITYCAILFFTIIFQSCTLQKSKYIGSYQLDITNSKLGKFQLIDSLLDLELEIKEDNIFEFSKDVPFIYNQNGTWEDRLITSIDNPPINKCFFIFSDTKRDDVLLPMDDEYFRVYFTYPMAKSRDEQVEFLCFIRYR